MFKIIQKLAPAPPTGLYSPVAPFKSTLQFQKNGFMSRYLLRLNIVNYHLFSVFYTQHTNRSSITNLKYESSVC